MYTYREIIMWVFQFCSFFFFLKRLLLDFTPNCWAGYLSCLTTSLCFLPDIQRRNGKERFLYSSSYQRPLRYLLARSEPVIHLLAKAHPMLQDNEWHGPVVLAQLLSHTKRYENCLCALDISCLGELLLFPLCWCKPDECFHVQTSLDRPVK